MKLCILYHTNDENTRSVEEFVSNFKYYSDHSVDLISLETKEGASMAQLYDIVDYPAILVIRDDGQLSHFWQGKGFPQIDEILGYFS